MAAIVGYSKEINTLITMPIRNIPQRTRVRAHGAAIKPHPRARSHDAIRHSVAIPEYTHLAARFLDRTAPICAGHMVSIATHSVTSQPTTPVGTGNLIRPHLWLVIAHSALTDRGDTTHFPERQLGPRQKAASCSEFVLAAARSTELNSISRVQTALSARGWVAPPPRPGPPGTKMPSLDNYNLAQRSVSPFPGGGLEQGFLARTALRAPGKPRGWSGTGFRLRLTASQHPGHGIREEA